MQRAIDLALRGRGYTRTNPCVGAVLVKNGEIVGEGWHQAYGQAHAEVNALAMAGSNAKGADLYVTLEPCTSYGKTPPCSVAIINAGIKRVFIGVIDHNRKHAGNGIRVLQEAGIEVVSGILATECANLIEDFTKYITTDLPYVTMKIAQSIDGKIATFSGESKWITGIESRTKVHELRKYSDIVLVGINTVLADDPELTVRLIPTDRHPARGVLDRSCKIPLSSKLVQTAREVRTIVFTSFAADAAKAAALRSHGVEVVFYTDLLDLLKKIGEMKMMNVFVEGGSTIFGAFMDAKLVDAVVIFVAPIIIGGEGAKGTFAGVGLSTLAEAERIKEMTIERVGEDIMIAGKLKGYGAIACSQG